MDHLVVYKSQRKLVLLSREKEVRSYKVALGAEAVGPKTRQGDHRTPEGSYILDAQNPASHFYKAFHISYPNSKDTANARKLGVNPGGDIMLHGLAKEYAWLGKSHTLHDWTDGCIAVTNEEMDGGAAVQDADKEAPANEGNALADLFWALLNSPEFALNH